MFLKVVLNIAIIIFKVLLQTLVIRAKYVTAKAKMTCETQFTNVSVLDLLRQSQWRWDYAVASHGGSFHSPIEYQRIMSLSLDRAHKARFELSKVLAQLGFIGDVPLPDVSTKAKAQAYIGLDMAKERADKKVFMETVVPEWIKTAKANNRIMTLI